MNHTTNFRPTPLSFVVAALVVLSACDNDSSPLKVIPTAPTDASLVAGGEQVGTVGQQLSEPLVVQVKDRYGNPVPAVEVTWTAAEGDGEVSPSAATTDSDGRAEATWTLGTRAGDQEVVARAQDIPEVTFRSTAEPGPPANITKASGDGQTGLAGMEVDAPLVVELTDEFDNPTPDVAVNWVIAQGGGSVAPATSQTNANGRASTRLTLGLSTGQNAVRAEVAALPNVVFEATGIPPVDLSIEGVYLTQSTQRFGGGVPLAEGRDGYLRVFARADRSNEVTPDVRVRFYQNGQLVDTRTIAAPASSVPTGINEGALGRSWNVPVPGSLIRRGLSTLVDVDPDEAIWEEDESNNSFPRSGSPMALNVRRAEEFRARLVPIYVGGLGATGNVSSSNKHDYLADLQRMFPVPGYDADVRSVYSTSVSGISTSQNWSDMLSEIYTLRVAEGSSRYYYGVVPYTTGSNPAWGGLGYVGYPASIGLDIAGASTAAHEWGHNFGRWHSPCGGPSGVDSNYPYSDGSIGVYGFDVAGRQLKNPRSNYDLMSYCGPEWISDYTYRAIMQFRESEAEAGRSRVASGTEATLVIWGKIADGDVTLEPAFRIETVASLPREPGPYTVEGRDVNGATLFSLSFQGAPVADLPGDVRAFAFAVPEAMARPDRIASIRLSGPGFAPATVRSPPAAADLRPDVSARRPASGVVELEWNAAAYPVAVIRDPMSGHILSIARGGRAVIATSAAELDMLMSDGVRTRAVRASIR